LLDARRLTFRFRGAKQPAVERITLHLEPGEWVAIAGRSGSGKSTLLRLLAGLHEPDEGDRVLDGRAIPPVSDRAGRRAWHRRLPLLPQDTARAFNPVRSLRAQLCAALALHGIGANEAARDAAAAAAFEACGLNPMLLDRAPHALSGGQRQRAALARLIGLGPRVLLLDEPTAALDPATTLEICGLLDELRRGPGRPGLLIAAHDPGVLARADRVLRIEGGRIP